MRTHAGEYVYKISSRYVEKRLSFAFLNAQKDHFLRFYEDFAIFRFSICVRFRPFKKCSRVILCVLDEHLTKNHASHDSNSKFLILPFWMLAFDDLHLTQGHKSLRGYAKALDWSQTLPMSFLGSISIWYGCIARRSQQGQKINNLTFDPACDVTYTILQHIRKVQAWSYHMPFSGRESAQ